MRRMRIIVGPDAMRVERHGIVSEDRSIDETQGTEDVRGIAQSLWESIRPLVVQNVQDVHHLRMESQRRMVAALIEQWPSDTYYPGPRPDLISTRPWGQAKAGEWLSLPHGVVARVLRADPERNA